MAFKKLKNDVDSAPPDEIGHFQHHFSLTMELDKHPYLSGMAAIATALVVIYIVKQGLGIKTANLAAVPATTAVSATSTQPYVTNNPLPVSVVNPVTIANPTPAVATPNTVRVRDNQTGTNGQFASYDASHTGVPLRDMTRPITSDTILTIPYSSVLIATGSPIQWITNGSSGSSSWTPVLYNGQNGYVSADDLS